MLTFLSLRLSQADDRFNADEVDDEDDDDAEVDSASGN